MACSSTSTTIATRAPPSGCRWSTACGPKERFSFDGRALQARGRDLRAQAGAQAAPDRLCRRRERSGQDDDRDAVRRLCHARRSGRGDRAQDRRHGGAPRARRRAAMQYGMAAYAIVRDSEAEAKRELERITPLPPKPPTGFDNFDQWLSGTAARARAEAPGIFGLEPRPAPQSGRHARASSRADRGI